MSEPPIGILTLNSRCPSPLGDVANPDSWPFPIICQTVEPATARRAMGGDGPDESLLEPLAESADRLVAAGAGVIITSCGLLTPFQDALQDRLPVPFIASSLVLLPIVEDELPPGKRAGIISIDASKLSQNHMIAAGANPDTPVIGVETGNELHRVIMGDEGELDAAAAEADMLAAAGALAEQVPDLGAVLLECPNMGPYAAPVMNHVGVRVYDIVVLVSKLYRELTAQR